MDNYKVLIDNIEKFTRKYYVNELIRGVIFFFTLGALYLFFTLYIEYFLWLKPALRTALLVLFVIVEVFLFGRYIVFPLLKLLGIRSGISQKQASLIIGQHFPDIDDKLLNTLQLYEQQKGSEMAIASINQKAENLKVFSFPKAVDFGLNKAYLKYLAIPLVIYLFTLFTGKTEQLNDSYDRLIHPQVAYVPPAPFQIEITNDYLEVLEGDDFVLEAKIVGETLPEEVFLVQNNQRIYLQKSNASTFFHVFKNVNKNIDFYLESSPVSTHPYTLEMIATPRISTIELKLQYPSYTEKTSETLEGTGSALVPEGTFVTWIVKGIHTDSVSVIQESKRFEFTKQKAQNTFQLTKGIYNDFHYILTASNQKISDYEPLKFAINVLKDEYPKIYIQTDIDSVQTGDAHFAGRLTDDYGISKLRVVYFEKDKPNDLKEHTISVTQSQLSDFLYTFPGELPLKDSQEYGLYFEVFDNDRVNQPKSTKSPTYFYYQNSVLEEEEKLLEEQSKTLDDAHKLKEKLKENQKSFEAMQEQLKNTPEIDFNTEKMLQEALKRQELYDNMMEKKLDDFKNNLDDQKENENPFLEEKKEDIQKRIDELKENIKDKEMMEELQKLAEKLQKEDLIDKMEEMKSRQQYKERALEELLELTKRFYVEQKMQQLSEKLDELAKKQEQLSENEENNKEKQEELSKEFDQVKKSLEELKQENEKLKEPMPIDFQEPEQNIIDEEQYNAEQNLESGQQSEAKENQKKAAKYMKQMAMMFQNQVEAMSAEQIEEDIASLRRILDNLLIFSFDQEELMVRLGNKTQESSNLSDNLKTQYKLKEFFEHIDDSLYTLSMRQAKLSPKINEYLSSAHYFLNTSVTSLEENQIYKSKSQQQFVMKSANDLAYLLNSLLDQLNNAQMSMGSGSGSGGSGQGFSLPDIIQKQGDLQKQAGEMMQQGQNKGDQQGSQDGNKEGEGGKKGEKGNQGDGNTNGEGKHSEEYNQELYEIYKQQQKIKEALENQLEDSVKDAGEEKRVKSLIRQMDQLQNILLEKGINQDVLKRMDNLEHQLLKLKQASYTQEKDNKRESKTNRKDFNNTTTKLYEELIEKFSKDEILNREKIPFKTDINARINRYFKRELHE